MKNQILKSKNDCVFFIETLGKTFDPRTKEKDLDFKLYPFQVDYVNELVDRIKNKRDIFIEKSRDMGVSWLTLYVLVWFWFFTPKFQVLIGSRKEDYVDNRTIDSLFGKIDYIINKLPVRPEGFQVEKHRTYMKLISPVTQSVISGESANPNFSRSGRYNCIFFDELAFWQHAQNSWEAAGDATPCRIAVTTPSEYPSYAKALRNSHIIDIKTLHWTLHPHKTNEWYEQEKLRRTTDEVARELDINWEGSTSGIVYPEIKKAEMGSYPYIANQPLYTGWDFGLDGVAIQWWQINPLNGKPRLVDSYHNVDKVIEYYFPLFGQPINSIHQYRQEDLEFIDQIKQLPKPTHYGDPDVEKRDLKTGTSTRQALNEASIYVQTNKKMNDWNSRKTEAKRWLQKGIEVNNTLRNRFWLECMRNARYPQRLDTSQAVTPIIKPIHDWTSHHRTAFEYWAVNYSDPKQFNQKIRQLAYLALEGEL